MTGSKEAAIETPEIDPALVETVDAWFWAHTNRVHLQSGEFTMQGHEYQIGMMQTDARVKVYKKGAQMGVTEQEVLGTLHGQIYGKYPHGVLYLFPSADDVSDFSKARFGPLIDDNPDSIGKFVKSTDSINIKRIGTGMLYLRGARSTQKVEGLKKDASKLRSIPVDKVVFDEVDLVDPDMVSLALERLSHSDIKEEVYLSTPTIPDYGIDKYYTESDQRIWIIKCTSCGRDCCLELDFPECVKFRVGGKAYRACTKCGAELHPRDGDWVPQYPGRDSSGWWISQLNSTFVDPGVILKLFNDPPNGNLQEVYNSKLGMAYIAAENRLSQEAVYACCGQYAMGASDNGPCGMGVDVGAVLHVVIGKKIAGGIRRIVWIGTVPEFEDLYDLVDRFHVRHTCIDFEPETRKARDFQMTAGHTVYLCRYKETIREGERWNSEAGVIDLARTEICDTTHKRITNHEYQLPRRSKALEEYAIHMRNIAKIWEEDERRGSKVYRYRKLGPDHFRHATNYFDVASTTLPEAIEDPARQLLKRMAEIKAEEHYDPLTFGLKGGMV